MPAPRTATGPRWTTRISHFRYREIYFSRVPIRPSISSTVVRKLESEMDTRIPPVTLMTKAPLAFSIKNFAAMVDVSPKTVRREIASGALPAVRIRNRLLITASAASAYLRGRTDRGENRG